MLDHALELLAERVLANDPDGKDGGVVREGLWGPFDKFGEVIQEGGFELIFRRGGIFCADDDPGGQNQRRQGEKQHFAVGLNVRNGKLKTKPRQGPGLPWPRLEGAGSGKGRSYSSHRKSESHLETPGNLSIDAP